MEKKKNMFHFHYPNHPSKVITCPRCGNPSLELLPSYASCSQCDFSPDTDSHVDLTSPPRRGDEIERAGKRAKFLDQLRSKKEKNNTKNDEDNS
jgi:hypothetical protein